MDNDFNIDLVDIAATISSSEVITIRFVAVGQRLLLDFRCTEIDGPIVKVVPPVKSVEERYRTLRQMRPRFAPPEKIEAIWWPRFVRSLHTTAVWKAVMERISDSGHVDAVRQAEDALAEMVRLEWEQQREAVRGNGFRTLWSASPAKR
ncbi:MAG: hypothetical protein ABI305_00580 [Tepidiformaceae bacterium]